MELFALLWRASPRKALVILLLSIAAGLSGGLLVPLVIHAAREVTAGQHYRLYLGLLPAVTGVFLLTKRLALQLTATLTEHVLEQFVLGILNDLRQADLRDVERRNCAALYTTLVMPRR